MDELAAVTSLAAPQASHRLDVFTRAPRAVLPRYSERLEFLLQPSDSDSQGESSATQIVEGRAELGEQHRIVLGDETNAGREPNPAGAGGRIGQREEWIKQRGVGGNRNILAARVWIARGKAFEENHMFGRPHGREVETFGVGRHRGYQLGPRQVCDADREETDFHF